MKNFPFLFLALAAMGCRHNELDVSEAQVLQHKATHAPPQEKPIHLPPGGLKVQTGDPLPGGGTADHAGTLVTTSDEKK